MMSLYGEVKERLAQQIANEGKLVQQEMEKPKYKNADAFKLMEYSCDACGKVETIWNSRDNVSPFGTSCSTKDCKGHMTHSNWHKDVIAPLYQPPPGSRYFADMTRKKAEKIAAEMIEMSNDFDRRHGNLMDVLVKGTDDYDEKFYEILHHHMNNDCSMDILTAE